MKKLIYFLAGLLISASAFSQSSNGNEGNSPLKGCTPHVYIDTNSTMITWSGHVETSFNQGDSLHLWCNHGLAHGILLEDLDTLYSGGVISGWSFYLLDTGNYYLDLSWGDDMMCPRVSLTVSIHVQYTALTSVIESYGKTSPQIYPSISSGTYQIKTVGNKLSQLRITDTAGQTLLFSTKNISAIDLTNFPPGIYYYAITDENENVFRGRIVKE